MYGKAGLKILKDKLMLEHILFNQIAEEPPILGEKNEVFAEDN